MIRGTSLSSVQYQKRTIRVLYGQTQAYPYDAQLDPSFDRTQGAFAGSNQITGSQSAILPGMVAVWSGLEVVKPVAAAWATTTTDYRPAGLFANFVGGNVTDFPTDFDRVGVWKGSGSVYELLQPAYDDTNLATDSAAIDGTAAHEVYLGVNAKSQLSAATAAGQGAYISPTPPARLINRLSANAVVVELLV